MGKLIIMQGLPASGKSTKAKEIMKADGNCIRLNKDLLRTMLHFDEFNGKKESLTRQASRTLATEFLKDKNVIIDDTNLNTKTLQSWKDLANEVGAKVEVVKMDTDWRECVERDSKRQNKVGKNVIVQMARQWGLYYFDKQEVICDIDGTLCDISERLHYVKSQEEKDWKSFFANISNDKPREEIISKVKELSKQYSICLVSGRPEDYRKETEEWMAKYEVPYDVLIMRRKGDKRPDDIVKREFLQSYFDKDNIVLVIDDRPRVIRMWQEEGLKVEDVGTGEEF